jgi:pilus assembly protein CpaE
MQMSACWRILTVCPNPQVRGELSQLIAKFGLPEPIADEQTYPDARSLGQLLTAHQPNLCFIDVTRDTKNGLATIQTISQTDQGIGVVALLPGNDPEMILKCLRQGATEFLIQPLTADQLEAGLNKLIRILPKDKIGPKNDGKVYSVMPAKGACGATTIATNLAFQWKRLGKKRVLLADLDPLGGTVSFLLKVKCAYSFVDVLHRAGSLDSDLWKAMVTTREGVDILLAPEVLVEGISELNDVAPIVNFARNHYDVIILDAGSVYGPWNLSQAQLADEVLLVTTNELPALQAAQRALNYLDTARVGRFKTRLVVNRYNRDVGLSKEVISTALNSDVYHVIPSDFEAIQKGLMEGKPISASSAVGKGMAQLGDRLAGREEVERKSSSTLSGLLSLFSRANS